MHEISLIACLSKQKKEGEEKKITAAKQENSLPEKYTGDE